MQTSWVDLLHRGWTISSLLLSPESGVDCPCPWFHANSVCCPVANCSRPGPVVNSHLGPLTTPGYGEISGPKILFSGFAPKQTKESSALAGHPYSATTWEGTNSTATCLPSWKLSKLDKPDMQNTAGEAGTSS